MTAAFNVKIMSVDKTCNTTVDMDEQFLVHRLEIKSDIEKICGVK